MLTAAMLGSTVLATCCTVADPHRPGRGRMLVASLVMLAAMIDVALVGAVVPLVWSVAVVVSGVWTVAGARGGARSAVGLRAHRGLAAIAMGALLIGHSESVVVHSHASLGVGPVVVALGAVVVVGGILLTTSTLVRCAGLRERVAAFEPGLMALAVGTMLAA